MSGNEEGFPRASWPPRSPAKADSACPVTCREVTRLAWTEQAEGMVVPEASSFQVDRVDISKAETK